MTKKASKTKIKTAPILWWLTIFSVIVFVVLGNCFFESVWFSQRTERLLRYAALDSCSAEKVSFSLFRGVRIKDLKIDEAIENGKTVSLKIPQLVILFRPIKLYSRWKTYKKGIHRRFETKRHKRSSSGKSLGILSDLYGLVKEHDRLLLPALKLISANGVEVSVDSVGIPLYSLTGGSCKIRIDKRDSSKIYLKGSVKNALIGALFFEKVHGKALLHGPCVTVQKIKGNLLEGKFLGEGRCYFHTNKIGYCQIEAKQLSLEKAYALQSAQGGAMTGRADFTLHIDSSYAQIDSLRGKGFFTMSDVSLEKLPALVKFVRLTDLSSLFHLRFSEISGAIGFSHDTLSFDSINGEGEPVSVVSSGWYRPVKSRYNFAVKGIFQPHYQDSLPEIVWNALVAEEEGRRSFKCTVYGDQKSLNISLEKQVMRRALNNAFQNFGKELRSLFRR